MVKRVADESARGCVYAINIRNDALENTSSLLEDSLNPLQVPLSTVPFFFSMGRSKLYIYYFWFVTLLFLDNEASEGIHFQY